MKSRLSLILIILLLMVGLVNSVSAFEFDNVKKDLKYNNGLAIGNKNLDYNPIWEKYEPIEVKNMFGLGKSLWKGAIDEHTESCGEDCFSTIEISLEEDGSLIDGVTFYKINEDGSKKEQEIRNYQFYLKVGEEVINVNDYEVQCKQKKSNNGSMEDVCSKDLVGSHEEVIEKWEEYILGDRLVAGNYKIKLEGEKKASHNIDWVIETKGETLDEWAVWNSTTLSQEVVSYYSYDEGGGSIAIDQVVGNGLTLTADDRRTGIIGDANFYTSTSSERGINSTPSGLPSGYNTNITVSFWVNRTGAGLGMIGVGEGSDGTYLFIDDNIASFGGPANDLAWSGTTQNTWHHIVVQAFQQGSNSNLTVWKDGVVDASKLNSAPTFNFDKITSGYTPGTGLYLDGMIDEFGIWNRTLSDSEIAELYNSGVGETYPFSQGQVNLDNPANNYATSNSIVIFNCSAFQTGATLVNITLFTNQSGTFEPVNSTTGLSGTTNKSGWEHNIVSEGNYLWSCQACDSDGDCGFATENRTVSVDTEAPQITINNPTGTLNYGTLGNNETLNWSITDTNLDSVWYNYNGTNVTVYGAENTTNFILETNDLNLTFYANDSVGNLNTTEVSWDYNFLLINETYSSSILEGGSTTFEININSYGSVISVGYLNYNNTNYAGTITSSGDTYKLTKTLNAPFVGTTTNVSFYWNLTRGDDLSYSLASKNQSVSPVTLTNNCSGNYVIYNFTLADEGTQQGFNSTAFNSVIKLDLDLYSSSGSDKVLDYYKEYNNKSSAEVCINSDLISGENYLADVQVQYGADNYSTEMYHIQSELINSSNLYNNITLYDLLSDDAQIFKLIVRDSSYITIEGALIQVERKYIENGTFNIVEIPKTDGAGIATTSLELNDVIYTFKIYEEGALISTFNDVNAICQTPTISTCEIDFNAYSSGITIPDYETADDLNYTLDYNYTSRTVTSNFVIPSGEPASMQLVVTRQDALGTAACTDTLFSSSGILSCVVPASFGNSSISAKLNKDSVEVGKGSLSMEQTPNDIFGVILTVLSFFVLLTLVGIGLSGNPVITAVFLFIGVVLIFSLNLVTNSGFVGFGATILFLAIAIILVVIKAARRS